MSESPSAPHAFGLAMRHTPNPARCTPPRRRGVGAVLAAAVTAVIAAVVVESTGPVGASPLAGERTRARAVARALPAPRTWIDMHNVDLRVADDAVVGIRSLRGEVIPATAGASAILDSTSSFAIRITSGTVALASADLSVILNRFVFGYRGSPLRDLRVRTSGPLLVQTGTLHKGVNLSFEITAMPSVTDSGLVRLHPTRVRVLGINGKALLHALGLRLDDLLDLSGSTAATVRGDDIYLDPTKILPPPAIAGRVTAVRVEGDALVQKFARLPDDSVFDVYARPDSSAPSYVYFRGGRLRFGRLEMHDTDLQILDLDPLDPLDLYLAQYNRQLVAGYSRNRPDLSLQAFFPDFTDLGAPIRAPVVAERAPGSTRR